MDWFKIGIGVYKGLILSPCSFNLYADWKESESEVARSCPNLCNPIDCSLPGSSVHGIFQAVVLEWIAISFSRGSSQPKARTWVSHIVDRRFIVWATREVLKNARLDESQAAIKIARWSIKTSALQMIPL